MAGKHVRFIRSGRTSAAPGLSGLTTWLTKTPGTRPPNAARVSIKAGFTPTRKLKKSENKKNGGKMTPNDALLKEVAQVYQWLDSQTQHYYDPNNGCKACGKCCDFETFDHHLFVTTPELMYLVAKIGLEGIKPMPTSRCPYNINCKCSIYENRFAGCRIFYCNADKDFQSDLSEAALKKLKPICTEFKIPYCYTDLATALNSYAD